MKKGVVLCSLLWLAGCLAVGCAEEEPVYRTPEGLRMTAEDELDGSSHLHSVEIAVKLLFYGPQDLLLSLHDSEVSVHSAGGGDFRMIGPAGEGDTTGDWSTVDWCYEYRLTDIYRYPLSVELPGCEWPYYSFGILLSKPETNGDYACYFRFRNEDKGICYQTPVYRISLLPVDGDEERFRTVTDIVK